MTEDRITLLFDSFRGFLEKCSDRISEQGIFLATEEIRPVGSTVEFHLGLDSDFPLLRGTGEVVWVVEPNGGGEASGMAVRYERTDEATATLARRIAERQRASTGSAFDLNRAGAVEPEAAAAGDAAAAGQPPVVEPSPSLATQAVDALIEDAPEPEIEPEPELAPESAPGPEIEPLPPRPEPEPEPLALPPEALEALEEESTVEMEPAPKRSRRGLWAALALIAALAGAGYWQRDLLMEKLGGSGEEDEASAASVAEPLPVEPVEPMIQEPVEPAIQAPAEPEVEPRAETPDPFERVQAPESSKPLTRIEEVRWRASAGVTLLELVADGAFASAGYSLERLQDPPRALLKIAGVTAPPPTRTFAVGSEEVVGVRTALHGTPPATRLHVVVDLADPTAEVTAEEGGAVLQLRIVSSAISP